MDKIPGEMLRGQVDTIILLSLLDADKHTSQIKEEIESRVEGQFELKQGTLYTSLQRITSQGFVKEYRSTSQDGKRRKFFQLTELGKNYIEENKDKWVLSRGVIDTLIQVPPDNTSFDSVFDYKRAEKIDIIGYDDDAEKSVQSNAQIQQLDSKLSEIASKVDQLNAALEDKAKESDAVNTVIEEEPTEDLTEVEKFLADSDGEGSEAIEKTETNDCEVGLAEYYKMLESDASPAVEAQRNETEKVSKTALETANIEEIIPREEVKPEPIYAAAATDYDDDYYDGESKITYNYKAVLQRLFPPTESVQSEPTQISVEPPVEIELGYAEEPPKPNTAVSDETITIESPKNAPPAQEQPKAEKKKAADAPYDLSDIMDMAEREGFRVRVSSNERSDSGKILINRLVASSSITFYLLLVIEALILAVTSRKVVELDFIPYLIFIAACAAFPLIACIAFFVNPKKKVDGIISFKNVIELSLLVVLNLIIIIFVASILINVDFTNSRALMLHVFYPLIMVLNLPIYFFIKYLKLDNRKYFS